MPSLLVATEILPLPQVIQVFRSSNLACLVSKYEIVVLPWALLVHQVPFPFPSLPCFQTGALIEELSTEATSKWAEQKTLHRARILTLESLNYCATMC